jgi:hypothetical protein
VKLNEDGSRDTAFASPAFSNGSGDGVYAISKAGFYVAGHFTSPGKGVVALDPSTGTVTVGFQPLGPNIGGSLNDVAYDGSRIVVAGNFTTFNSSSRRGIAALATDGTLDANWSAASVANGDGKSLASLRDTGEIMLGGSFTSYAGNASMNGTAKLAPATGALASGYSGAAGLSVTTIYKLSEP